MCWLTLPGEGVEEIHAELALHIDARLRVRHVGKQGATWINKARIAEGVLREGDVLVIGPYRAGLRRQDSLGKVGRTESPGVIIEDDESAEEPDDQQPEVASEEAGSAAGESAPRQRLRWAICLSIIGGAAVYLGWWLLAPTVSRDMPATTIYRCPVDGSIMRSEWSAAPPKCPQCGALCLGTLPSKYKSEKPEGAQPVATSPSPASSTKSQSRPSGKDKGR